MTTPDLFESERRAVQIDQAAHQAAVRAGFTIAAAPHAVQLLGPLGRYDRADSMNGIDTAGLDADLAVIARHRPDWTVDATATEMTTRAVNEMVRNTRFHVTPTPPTAAPLALQPIPDPSPVTPPEPGRVAQISQRMAFSTGMRLKTPTTDDAA